MMQDLLKTRFRDIAEREKRMQEELYSRLLQLKEIETTRGYLTQQEREEKNRLKALHAELDGNVSEAVKLQKSKQGQAHRKADEVCDPLFVGVRQLFNDGLLTHRLVTHNDGYLIFQIANNYIYNGIFVEKENSDKEKTVSALQIYKQHKAQIDEHVVRVALTLGFLVADDADAPPVLSAAQAMGGTSGQAALSTDKDSGKTIVSDTTDPAWKSLTRSFYEAIGEAKGLHDLAVLVLPILANEGDTDSLENEGYGPNVNVGEFARVMRELQKNGVTVTENQLRRRVNEALDKVQFIGETGVIEEQSINLPDLDEVTDNDIVAENVRLMGPMIVSAMFDELKAFQVVEHLVERFQRGTLSIVSGEAGKLLYRYWREAPNRISEVERRTFYATTMGIPGGEAGDFVNRNFNDLWLRFVSSVSEFVRQGEVDKLLRAGIPSAVSQQQVRKAARDLATNLSLHGYGMAYYAALELQEQIKFMIRLLGNKEICANFGARDMWQVIDQVATLELGGAKTSSRYRTLATCGTIITAWIARNAKEIMAATGPLLDLNEINNPPARISGEKATTHPNDYDLVNSCELWLADTGTLDSQVEEMAKPYQAPVQTSRPVQMPGIVQDMLSGMGGLGAGFGRSR